MAKMHEVLAVEGQMKGQAEKVRKELTETFQKKHHLFGEAIQYFRPTVEGHGEARIEAQSSIQSTVFDELRWIASLWAKAIDTSYAVAEGNMSARADVVLDNGTTFATGVPATALLELEKRATEVQQLVAAIPTLDPAKGFEPDPSRKAGIYKARTVVKTRTVKEQVPIVLLQPTKEHPGKAELVSKDSPIGTIELTEWSGMVTPATKAAMLERAEEIARAIKKARSRANNTDVAKPPTIGDALLSFVFGTPNESGKVQAEG
jgi:hypothetical protein